MKKCREVSSQESQWLQEADNPATAPNRLCELAQQGKALRRVCASNPNMPTEWLVWLAQWEWRAVLQNPVLQLLLLEDPGFPAKLPIKALREILKSPAPPPEFLSLLLRHSDTEIRESARLHRAGFSADAPDTAPALTPHVPVRGGAALLELLELELAPPWVLQEALEAAQGPLRKRAAKIVGRGNDFDEPLRQRLGYLHMAGASLDLSRISKGHPKMRPELLEILASGGPFARRLAARHPNTSPEYLALLAEVHQEARIRRSAAANPSTPLATLVSLASTGASDIRAAVAGNPGASSALLDTLSGDAQVEVRRGVAERPTCPPGALARLGRDADDKVRRRVARNPATDGATLEVLAKDSNEKVRVALAKRRNCPVVILSRLLQDDEWLVRHHAAGNNVLPGTVAIRRQRVYQHNMKGDEDKVAPSVVEAVLAPPSPEELEFERMFKLLRGEDTATPEILLEAAGHADKHIRGWAAYDQNTSTELLTALAQDPEANVRATAARNPALPASERLKLWQDPDPAVRMATLESSDMPLECFEQLARDPDEEVRRQTAYREHLPLSIQLRMAREDTSLKVLETLSGSHRNYPIAEEVLLALLERGEEFPTAAKQIAGNCYLSRAVLEKMIPALTWHERETLIFSQTFEMKWRPGYFKEPFTPYPDDLLLQMLELPENVKYMRRHVAQKVLDYWAVSPAVIEAIAREILDENAENDKKRHYRRRRSSQGGLLRNIARHARTPPALLAELTRNRSHPVRLAALENPQTPPEARTARRAAALLGATKRSGQTNKLCGLAHPETDPQTLERFARKGRWMERLAVARNPGAPRDLLLWLLDDTNLAVSAAAQKSLEILDTAH